jgi:hypothetical protein
MVWSSKLAVQVMRRIEFLVVRKYFVKAPLPTLFTIISMPTL